MSVEQIAGGPPLPYRTRITTLDDVEEITRLVNVVAIDEAGRSDMTTGLLRSMLTEPGHDPAVDTAMVMDPSGSVVGFEWLRCAPPFTDGVSWGGVHPDHVGRGIGTWLVHWAADRMLEHTTEATPGEPMVHRVWTHADHVPSQALLAACGYESATVFHEMVVEFSGQPPPTPTVDGVTIAGFRPGIDIPAYSAAHEEAFSDHFGHVAVAADQAEAHIRHLCEDEQFDSGLWWLALDGDEVAGYLQGWPHDDSDERLGYVATLGVRPRWRGRGLGRALLLTSLAEFHRRGCEGVSLQVDADNRTPALGLYESVGMQRTTSRHVLRRTIRKAD